MTVWIGLPLWILAPEGTWNRLADRLFGLTWNDTVADYRSASISKRIYLHEGICEDGECLHKMDWTCGFVTETWRFEHSDFGLFSEALEDCFGRLTKVAPPATKLDVLRKVCGRHYMTFDARAAGSSMDRCDEAGGIWGEKPPVAPTTRLLLLEAGIWP